MSSLIVHCKKGKYFDRLVDRSTIFGNPWSHKLGTKADFIAPSRKDSVINFRDWLSGSRFQEVLQQRRASIIVSLPSLRGLILACWCNEEEPWCHAKVLSEFANGNSC